jgi:glycerol uptake facilitator protein
MSSPFVGELLGTMFLVLLGDGAVAEVLLKKSKGENSGWIVITTGWAFAVMVGVFVAIATGSEAAHINPAVTIGMAVAGEFPWAEVPTFIAAQLIGAFLGAIILFLAWYKHWGETEDAGAKLGIFSTGPAIRSVVWNNMTEIVGTFVLVFGVWAIFFGDIAPALAPFLVGALVWGIGLSLGGPTGYAINPARDLAPRIAHAILPIPGKGGSDWGYSWIPVVGPIIGGILAGLLILAF